MCGRKNWSLILLGAVLSAMLIGDALAAKHHLFCHSHDDLGWLKTIKGYYERVEKIFLTTIEGLEKSQTDDPRLQRKFAYSEVGFLKIFLQSPAAADTNALARLQELTKKGQWEWVNGGISQADSACTSFEDLATNYFAGQRYLKKNFGVTSKVAWQLDPFGHSQGLMAVAHMYGMTHAFFNRIPQAVKVYWTFRRELEFVWQLPNGVDMISHVHKHYSAPDALACDTDCRTENFDEAAYKFQCLVNDRIYRSDNFFYVGDDFNWEKAEGRFDFVDFALNKNQDSLYSTPGEYVKVFDSQNRKETLPVFKDDFFVYTSGLPVGGDAWSGYFTTKPHLKYRIRRVQKLVRELKARIALAVFGPKSASLKAIADKVTDMTEEISIFLHHDAITGTSVETVDLDYLDRLIELEARCLEVINSLASTSTLTQDQGLDLTESYFCDAVDVLNGKKDSCDYFEAYQEGKPINVSYFQTLSQRTDDIRRVVVPDAGQNFEAEVRNSKGEVIPSIYHCLRRPGYCEVYFEERFQGVDADWNFSYFLQKVAKKTGKTESQAIKLTEEETVLDMGDQTLFVATGHQRLVPQGTNSKSGEKVGTFVEFFSISSGSSGHYILRYGGKPKLTPYNKFETVRKFETPSISLSYASGDKIDSTIVCSKLIDGCRHEIFVKKVEDFWAGIDVIAAYRNSALNNYNKEMVTDSNGLFEVGRRPGWTFEESVYPVTAYARIKERPEGPSMAVFSSLPCGSFAGVDGLYFYVQRSASRQDNKGNSEILRVWQNVLVEHTLPVNSDKVSDETFWRIRNRQDTIRESVFRVATALPDEQPTGNKISPGMDNPVVAASKGIGAEFQSVRFNMEVVDATRMILRVWNFAHETAVDLPIAGILKVHFPKATALLVENSYVFEGPANAGEVPEKITLKPYEAATILLA